LPRAVWALLGRRRAVIVFGMSVRVSIHHYFEAAMANTQQKPTDPSNDSDKRENPNSNRYDFVKFLALIAGLFALAYVAMKVLAIVWPE
jgi:hypothetical protein